MILQDEFKNSGYVDILVGKVALEYKINLEDLFDQNQKPEELLNIFISKQGDDLFFVLNGDTMGIDSICDQWDERIRVFMIINGKSEALHKLKYNIVQLVVYSGDTPDKSREGNLLISRKIIIKGDITNPNRIVINDDAVIELPFHMIPTGAFAPNEEQIKNLEQLLPQDENLLDLMNTPKKKVSRKKIKGVLDKSFAEQEYKKIEEWLRNDNSQN